jgi:hypothetical protein
MPPEPVYPTVDDRFHGVLLKALLVHAARWDDDTTEALRPLVDPDRSLHYEHIKDEITRLFGYGRPEIERALDCTEQRATLRIPVRFEHGRHGEKSSCIPAR